MAESSEETRHLEFAREFDCLPEPLPTLRHSTSHVMAQAVKRLFPEVKVAIGPAIQDGFYYDFLKATPFTPEDLERIEKVMREIVKADYPFTREEMERERAIAFFEERGEPFKVEILRGLEAPTVSIYRQGDFLDLCRGPHVASTGHVKHFKLLSSAGAYWRGDEKNPMLQRIYGTAWLTQEELDKHLWRLEEAKKRDHRKLGRELDLFDFYDIAPGAPFWLPGGLVLVRQLTQDDAHLYLRPEQLQGEITDLLDLVREWYGTFTLQPSYRLATRPPDKLGTEQQWDQAEDALHQALRANDLVSDLDKGGGAFYGPKIDIDVEDALGRQWQLATIQVDLTMLPERMQCEYIDTDGQAKRPVVIHRVIFGSYERFVAI